MSDKTKLKYLQPLWVLVIFVLAACAGAPPPTPTPVPPTSTPLPTPTPAESGNSGGSLIRWKPCGPNKRKKNDPGQFCMNINFSYEAVHYNFRLSQ